MRMRRLGKGSAVTAAAAALALLAAPQARADSSLAATGVVSTGFSDNILGVPDTDDPTAPQVESDVFMNLSPGVVAAFDSRRAIHNLGYVFTAQLYAAHSEANSFANSVNYQGIYYVSALSTWRVNASGAAGRVSAFDRTNSDLADVTDELPRGDLTFVSGQASAAYRRVLTPFWSWGGSLGVRGYTPTNSDTLGSNYSVPGTVSIDRSFRDHIFAASLSATFASNSRPNQEEDQQSVNGGPRLSWTWDITQRFSSFLYAGATAAVEAPDFLRGVVLPTGGATLSYVLDDIGSASVSYQRGVTANLFTSDVTLTNRYTVRVGLPITERLGISGAAGYRRGRFVNFMTEELVGRTEQVSANASLAYAIDDAWALAARISSSRQRRDNPITGEMFGIARNEISVVLTGRFPSRVASAVPSEGVRVDETSAAHDVPDADPR